MAYDNIANISIELQTTATSVSGFSVPLFLTTHSRFTERVRSYEGLEQVAEDFEVTDNAYIAAQSFFGSDPKPDSLKIGRIQASAIFDIGPVAEDVQFSIDLAVNENTTSPVTYTALLADDEEAVVDAFITAIDALYSSELTTTKIGSGATAQLSIEVIGDNIFVLGDLVNMSVALTAEETAVQAKNECVAVDPDFYWITYEGKDETNILALAADTSATERRFTTSLSDVSNLTALSELSTDIGAKLKDAGYERVDAIYHHEADKFPELAMISEFTTVEPGTKDYYAKSLAGFGYSRNADTLLRLSSTEQDNLIARNMNAIVTQGGINIYVKGLSFSGNQLSNLVFRDFLTARLREAYIAWRVNRNKIPFDQVGIDSAESVFRSVCDRYVSTQQRPHAISTYVPNFPRVEDVSFNDKANGLLRAVATIYLTGSIFSVDLDGILTYDANF